MELEEIILLETNIDHLTGEEIGHALTALNELQEVLDASWLSGIGKKNRPIGILRLLCQPRHEEMALQALFRHTHTLGIRRQKIERYVLPRESRAAKVAGEEIPAKAYLLEGVEYLRPEADALAKIARKKTVGTPALRFRPGSGLERRMKRKCRLRRLTQS